MIFLVFWRFLQGFWREIKTAGFLEEMWSSFKGFMQALWNVKITTQIFRRSLQVFCRKMFIYSEIPAIYLQLFVKFFRWFFLPGSEFDKRTLVAAQNKLKNTPQQISTVAKIFHKNVQTSGVGKISITTHQHLK